VNKRFIKYFFIHIPVIFLYTNCSNQNLTFEELLYNLAEIEESQRAEVFSQWLSNKDEYPVIEGYRVYFIYKEKRDQPVFLVSDINQWQTNDAPLLRIIGTEYYFRQEELPPNACIEYKFYAAGKYIPDSLNNRTSESYNGVSSLLMMPQYQYPAETLRKRNYIYTELDTVWSGNKSIMAYLYKHKDANNDAPLICVFNGYQYLNLFNANIILDNLIENKTIKPLYAVFVANKPDELFNDLFSDNVFKEIIPLINKKYELATKRIAILGFSKAGLAGLNALRKYDNVIHSVIMQNPFYLVQSPVDFNWINDTDFSHINFYYNYSLFEGQDSLYREFEHFLKNRNINFKNDAYDEGTSYLNIKGHLDDALLFLFENKIEL
jgi:hypothetical protein